MMDCSSLHPNSYVLLIATNVVFVKQIIIKKKMIYNIKKITNILVCLLFLLKGYGQININMPSSPIAPNVSSILKSNDFPVSYHTGVPDISIPIYTIALNDINFPIKINYNASGIRVNEESGTVGLGWEISCYGIISRTIIEANDFNNQVPAFGDRKYFSSNIPDFLIPDGYIQYPVFHMFDYYSTAPNMPLFNDLLGYFNILPDAPNTVAELAPDIYSYNFNGFSGKFALTHRGEVYKKSIDQIQIKYDDGNISLKDPSKWTAITPDGTSYTFAQKQLTEQRTSTIANDETSSWYLTEIKTMNGNIISFNYDVRNEFKYSISGLEVHNRTSSMVEQPEASPFTPVLHQTVTLKNITFPGGTVEFSYNYDRQDLASDPRLTCVVVKNENEIIKKVELLHDYFNANATNQSEMISLTHIKNVLGVPSANVPSYFCNISEDWNRKRLKLLNINFYGGTGTSKEAYSFTYNEKSLPTKLSTARDHWGYHNGKKNNGLVPKQVILNNLLGIETFESTHGEANRDVDVEYNQSFILNSMKMPTGGIINYEYEPNSQRLFDNDGDGNIGKYLNTKIGLEFTGSRSENTGALFTNDFRYDFTIPSGYGVLNVPLKIELELLNKRTPSMLGGEFGIYIRKKSDQSVIYKILENMRLSSFYNGDNMDSVKFTLKSNTNINFISSEKYELQIIGYSDLSKSSIFNSIKIDASTYKKATPVATRVDMTTGGLRIKKISVLDGDRVIREKKYEYSSSKLITNYPRYRYFRSNKVSIGERTPLYEFYETSDGIRNKSYPVGYGSVTVYDVDYVSGNNGKSVYKYITKSDEQLDYSSRSLTKSEYESKKWGTVGREFDHTPEGLGAYSYIAFAENGLLSGESYYKYNKGNNDYVLVKSIDYDYDIVNHGILWGIKRVRAVTQDDGWEHYNVQELINVVFAGRRVTSALPTAFIYPAINQQKINLINKTERLYDSQSLQPISQNTSYIYNIINNQIQEERILGNNDSLIIKKYTYPIDKQDIMSKKMVEYNRVNDIVEIVKNTHGKIKQIQNIYSDFLNIPRVSRIMENTGINNSLEERISYNNYDKLGNYSYISKDDATKIVYIWSYSGQYLIAEIKNATYSDIVSILGQTLIDRVTSTAVPSESDLLAIDALRNNTMLKEALITTYTYKPLVGILTVTNPSGIRTYYEYDSFGRLKRTYFKEGTIERTIQIYEYHYQKQ